MARRIRTTQLRSFSCDGRRHWPDLTRDSDGSLMLLSTCRDNNISRWDMNTGALLWASEAILAPIQAFAVAYPSHSPAMVAIATDMGVERLDATTGMAVPDANMEEINSIWDVATGLLPDGRAFIAAAGHCDWLVYRWDATTAEPLGPPMTGHNSPVKAITAAQQLPNGTSLIASQDEHGLILCWNAATGALIGNPIHGPSNFNMEFISIPQPGGRIILVSLDADGLLSRCDADSGEPIGTPRTVRDEIHLMTGVGLGETPLVLVSDDNERISIHDAVTGDELTTLAGSHPSAVNSPDGTVLVATCIHDDEIAIHRLTSD
jgi:WD40 repeat protein